MNDFFEMLTKPPENDAIGWFLIILLWIICAILLGLCTYGVLAAINYWFRPVEEGYGEVKAMHFEEAHYSTVYMYNAATKTQMPITTWHPNAWELIIEKDGAEDNFPISKEKYVRFKLGDKIKIEYTTGRLWKSLSIKSAYL